MNNDSTSVYRSLNNSPNMKVLRSSQSFISTRDFSNFRNLTPAAQNETKARFSVKNVKSRKFELWGKIAQVKQLEAFQIKEKLEEMEKFLPKFKGKIFFRKRDKSSPQDRKDDRKSLKAVQKKYEFLSDDLRNSGNRSMERVVSAYGKFDKFKLFARKKCEPDGRKSAERVSRFSRKMIEIQTRSRELLEKLGEDIFGKSFGMAEER